MAHQNSNKLKMLRRKQVEERTDLSRSTIYFYIQDGTFPKPVKLGPRSVGWLENEIEDWLKVRVDNRNKCKSQS